MIEVLLELDNILIVDFNREIIYYEFIIIDGVKWSVEDDSKIIWLNSKGEKVKLKN